MKYYINREGKSICSGDICVKMLGNGFEEVTKEAFQDFEEELKNDMGENPMEGIFMEAMLGGQSSQEGLQEQTIQEELQGQTSEPAFDETRVQPFDPSGERNEEETKEEQTSPIQNATSEENKETE